MLKILPLLLFTTAAHATVMTYQNTSDLVAHADLILIATVENIATHGTHTLSTRVTLRPEHTLFGPELPLVTLEQWGGTTPEKHARIPGDATFHTGERVLVFLRTSPGRSGFFLTALGQSSFTLTHNQARRDFHEITLLNSPHPKHTWPLDQLLIELESLIAARQAGLK